MAHDLQSVLPQIQAAMKRYEMIRPGDRVCVGVSGGKDSLVLLCALARIREFYDVPFSLCAVTLDPCFSGEADYSAVEDLCKTLDVPYTVKRTRLWEVIKEQGQADHPCSLCAKMRRGALHKAAKELDCNVVALGHHKDDAAETFFMNLASGATLGCFSPKTYLDRSDLTLIRPLLFLSEAEVAAVSAHEHVPVVKSACPVDGNTGRAAAKKTLASLSADYGDMGDKIEQALQKAGMCGW